VIDKSIFHALYHCDDKLCAFVKNYNVVLPDALAVECLISEKQKGPDDKDPEKLFRSFQGAIKAGAKIGYSSKKLFQAEKTTLCPVKSVVDEDNTKMFRNGVLNLEDIKQEAERCRKTFEPTINLLSKIAEKLYENLCNREKLSEEFRKEQKRMHRFKNWIKGTDKSMKDILKKEFMEQISSHADASWFTWQITRLYFACCLDWCFKKNLNDSIKVFRSNDYYDIEHVSYLSRADGLLTNDQELQEPLAKAAFPEKEVFVVDTRVNESRKVQDVFDDIVNLIPKSYRIG
jgi:hypothetical protein